jgi:tetratricopeptide (TPR) repeat protein
MKSTCLIVFLALARSMSFADTDPVASNPVPPASVGANGASTGADDPDLAARRAEILKEANRLFRENRATAIELLKHGDLHVTPEELVDVQEKIRLAAKTKLEGIAPPGSAPGTHGTIPTTMSQPLLDLANDRMQRNPGDPKAFASGGDAHYMTGDYKGSFDAYGRAIDLGSKEPEVILGYGGAAYRLGDYALAQRSAEMLLAADPGNQSALSLYHTAKDRAPTVTLPSVIGAQGGPSAGFESGGAQASMPQGAAARGPGRYAAPGMTTEQVLAAARPAPAPRPRGRAPKLARKRSRRTPSPRCA